MDFYHGTVTNLVENEEYLLPANETGILREDFRKKLKDKVFLTNSKVSAIKYAKKAQQKFNGEPIILKVKPDKESLHNINGTEYITNFAKILLKEKI